MYNKNCLNIYTYILNLIFTKFIYDYIYIYMKFSLRYITRESEGRGVKISEVVIKSAQRKDSDTFTCSASNPFGEDKTTVRLVVQGMYEIKS